MRYQLWDWDANEVLMSFVHEDAALVYLRSFLGSNDPGTINRIGLVDKGAPGEVLTYPLEGAALLAKAFGLEEEIDALPHRPGRHVRGHE
jgi:hypothetical protein